MGLNLNLFLSFFKLFRKLLDPHINFRIQLLFMNFLNFLVQIPQFNLQRLNFLLLIKILAGNLQVLFFIRFQLFFQQSIPLVDTVQISFLFDQLIDPFLEIINLQLLLPNLQVFFFQLLLLLEIIILELVFKGLQLGLWLDLT